MSALPLLLLPFGLAAPPTVPDRQIPPAVLVELQLLENRFELALAADCEPPLCSSMGCVYLDHSVADQPRSRSMPGLGQEAGPGAVDSQEYLTRAQCSFSHEATVESAAAQAMVRRLQTRLTRGWTVVSVEHQVLPPIPPPEAEPEALPEPVAQTPVIEPEEWTEELWTALLPHFFWMIGLGLLTLAVMALIWAGRRLGRISPEEQALLAELDQPEVEPPAPAAEVTDDGDQTYVAEQEASWRARLEAMDPAEPDAELQTLIRDRLRAGDLTLLAKAVLRFPDHFPAAFPSDGEIATAKLELADLLQHLDTATLPTDSKFFRSLQRHALAATLATQSDARIVRSLREDFGAAGLVEIIGRQPPRMGALLFALAPPQEQQEVARLLAPPQVAGLSEQRLRSNRMDPGETRALFQLLRADSPAHIGIPIGAVTDCGTTFDAAGALALLLPMLDSRARAALFGEALARFHGSLPAWTRGILVPEMLFALSREARADLLLELEIEPLAAWFSLLEADMRSRLLDGMPDALRASIQGASVFPSRARQLALAGRGRRELARGFQRQLARAGIPFERVVRPDAELHE